ncbi:MAG: GNAT family N-acetyltransferase [Rubrivivax sp.]
MQLVRPARVHMPAYAAALRRGWSPNTMRPEAAAEELQQIDSDAEGFLALMHDPEAKGPPVTMPDGSQRPRIPGLRRWMWADDGDLAGGGSDDSIDPVDPLDPHHESRFIGSISLRWMAGHAPLPPHVLGHIGYTVVPWWQRRGHGTQALALMLGVAREMGLPRVEITTDPDNIASQKVITGNSGRLVGSFDDRAVHGRNVVWRYAIDLARRG